MNLATLCVIAALVVFIIAALVAFGAFTSGVSVLGLIALGSAFFAAGHLPL